MHSELSPWQPCCWLAVQVHKDRRVKPGRRAKRAKRDLRDQKVMLALPDLRDQKAIRVHQGRRDPQPPQAYGS